MWLPDTPCAVRKRCLCTSRTGIHLISQTQDIRHHANASYLGMRPVAHNMQLSWGEILCKGCDQHTTERCHNAIQLASVQSHAQLCMENQYARYAMVHAPLLAPHQNTMAKMS